MALLYILGSSRLSLLYIHPRIIARLLHVLYSLLFIPAVLKNVGVVDDASNETVNLNKH